MALLEADGRAYDEVDVDALRRCVDSVLSEGGFRREQIESLLTKEPWIEVAHFCAYRCQMRSLGLPPWAQPPSTCSEEDAEASALLDRMLENDVSQWEPDPLLVLSKVEEKEPA